MTIATAVEILNVPAPSPPVPHVSMAPGGASTFNALARMIRAAPVNSAIVSPRTLKPIRNALAWVGVAVPDINDSKAASASVSLRPAPSVILRR